VKKSFLNRFTDRAESLDPSSRQTYLLRLAREHGFFSAVFDAITEGILVIDGEQKIRYVNAGARSLLALPEEFSSVRVSQLLPGIDFAKLYNADSAEFERVSRQELEVNYPAHRILQFYLVPIEQEAGLAAIILQDVTERCAKERSDIAGETAQAVALLAGAVAHEIGNPLNSLYLNLQLLEESLGSPEKKILSNAETKEMISSCRQEVERLDSIVSQFLGAVRPGKPVFAPLSLADVVRALVDFMAQECRDRGIAVTCDFPAPMPQIQGDAAQLKQAFYNILKNDLQATPHGGTIQVKGSYDDDFVTLVFADNGCGIDFEKLSQMFKPFASFRAGGNGIGTMIIERVCREHGAELSVDSKPGCGTAITIRFRRRPRQLKVLPPAETSC